MSDQPHSASADDRGSSDSIQSDIPDTITPAPSDSQDTTTINPFEQAIKIWTDIGLSSLQKILDDEGDQIVENQTTSLKGRKELADRTKAFRKLSDDDKLIEIKSLLKLYQSEIDNLTNRGKYAETSFMNLYKLLAEAPDPKPLLEASVDSVMSASEVNRLMIENSRLSDLVNRHADYDSIKAKLLKVEQQSIESSRAKVLAKEAEMNALIDEQNRNWKLREDELLEQIEDLRANKDVAEARLLSSQIDPNDLANGSSSRLAELELVANDLERANRKVVQVENRNLELRSELESLKSGLKASEEKAALETQISDLQGENAIILAKIGSLNSSLLSHTASTTSKIDALERDVSRKTEEITGLRERLRKQQDYEEIKRELDVLKSIEFDDDSTTITNNDYEYVNDENNNGAPATNGSGETKLEKMLLGRNKKLTSDLTVLRVANAELTEANNNADRKIAAISSELEAARALNNKLEDDLLTLKHNSGSSPAISMVSGWNNSAWGASGDGNLNSGRVSPTSSILRGREGSTVSGGSGGRIPQQSGASSTTENSILPIITQQRDRFRQRNTELEQELRKNWSLISSLQKEIEAVKKDNLELYEKSRYMSSFNSNARGGKNSVGLGLSAEDRYRSVYEEGLTPFQQFRGRESERAISHMGPLERIAYSFFQSVLVNRLSRNLFFLYCLLLHFLVMIILFYGVNSSPTLEVSTTAAAAAGVGKLQVSTDQSAVELAQHPV